MSFWTNQIESFRSKNKFLWLWRTQVWKRESEQRFFPNSCHTPSHSVSWPFQWHFPWKGHRGSFWAHWQFSPVKSYSHELHSQGSTPCGPSKASESWKKQKQGFCLALQPPCWLWPGWMQSLFQSSSPKFAAMKVSKPCVSTLKGLSTRQYFCPRSCWGCFLLPLSFFSPCSECIFHYVSWCWERNFRRRSSRTYKFQELADGFAIFASLGQQNQSSSPPNPWWSWGGCSDTKNYPCSPRSEAKSHDSG